MMRHPEGALPLPALVPRDSGVETPAAGQPVTNLMG